MSLDAWHSSIRKAWYHVEQKQFYYAFDNLVNAHLAWLKMPKEEIMNEVIYNQWADIIDFLRIVGRWPVVVLNEHYVQTVENLADALTAFEHIPHDVNAWINFNKSIQGNFHYLLKGLQMAANYCEKQDLAFDSEDKVLSFEFSKGTKVSLYGWTDSPPEGSEEALEEAATIAFIQEDFNELFYRKLEEEAISTLAQGKKALAKKNYEAAIAPLLLAIKEEANKSDKMQIEIYEMLHIAYYNLGKYRQALDMLMKAHLLGLAKRNIKSRVVEICDIMLAQPAIKNDAIEKERWLLLKEDYI